MKSALVARSHIQKPSVAYTTSPRLLTKMIKLSPLKRIAYLSGPVEAEHVYYNWKEGKEPTHFGTNYLMQFFDLCSEYGSSAYVITTRSQGWSHSQHGAFQFENMPLPENISGAYYHIKMLCWCIRALIKVIRFKPDLFVVTAVQNYWFLFTPLLLFKRTTIVPSVHCTLWPKFGRVRLSWRLLLLLNKSIFFPLISNIMCVSPDIADQLITMNISKEARIELFLPTYSRDQFVSINPIELNRSKPLKILYMGRIEQNKGVYDLLKIARQLAEFAPNEFQIDICGAGSELSNLRTQIAAEGLGSSVICHGFCNSNTIRRFLGLSHVVVVPTTSSFEEGFNKVCIEAVLAGRPVITSAVCPALSTVRKAAVEVRPDSVSDYVEALRALKSDDDFYQSKCTETRALQKQFYDPNNSWLATIRKLIKVNFSIDSQT
jgi:glycosyltransferase involved in cell wall biosynthesis